MTSCTVGTRPPERPTTIGSLCSGYGGLELALTDVVGGKVLWHAETDPAAVRVLAERWPGVPNLGDIQTVDWYAVPDVDWLTAGYPCFAAETLVLTVDGYVAICNLEVGMLVHTHRQRWRRVTAVMNHRAPETVEVKAQGTHRVVCTPEHPFLTEDQAWTAAKELAGNRIVQSLPLSDEPFPYTTEVCWLLGRHLADGYVQARRDRKHGGRVTITCHPDEAEQVASQIRAAGMNPCVSHGRTATKIVITRNWFYELARKFGRGAANKLVPGWVIADLSVAQAEAMLDGYLTGDGSYDHKRHVWSATSVSKSLVYSMALIAQRARDVVASVRCQKVPATTVIQGRTVNQRLQWKLSVPDRNRSGRVDANLAYKRCRTVTPAGPAEVWNIAVEEDESYMVDGAIVHNCQPFSDAGQRKGTDDERHLWPDVARAIRVLRPRYVLLENVRGHLRRGFGTVLNGLAAFGYVGSWVCVRASDVGAPHRRERLFVVAADASHLRHGDSWPRLGRTADLRSRNSIGGHDAVLRLLKTPTAQLAINGGSQPPDKRRLGGHGPTLADEVENLLATKDSSELQIEPLWNDPKLLPTPLARAQHGDFAYSKSPDLGTAVRLLPTPRASDGEKGSPNQHGSAGDLMLSSAVQPSRWGMFAPAIERWETVHGILAPPPTDRYPGSSPLLSARFVEWLMGLPEGWVTRSPRMTRNDALRILGNGVVPQQAAHAIRLLLARHTLAGEGS